MALGSAASILDGPRGTVESLVDHESRCGVRPQGSQSFLAQLASSELRGRGGAAFPAARKWQGVMRQGAHGGVVVIGNGAEGEPCSYKDRLLLRTRPHLVLDGLQIAAETLGASDVILYMRHDDDEGRKSIKHALKERRGRGERTPKLVRAPNRYVASEETAVVARVEGKPARPRQPPPRPYRQGAWGRPTLLHNVETLARVAIIARGIDVGSSALVTLWRSARAASVVDLRVGTGLGEALEIAGVTSGALRAVLVGGYFGTWLEPSKHQTTGLGTDVPLGAGVLALLDSSHCGLAESSRVLTYLAGESAEQCGPCMFGLPAMARGLAEICIGRSRPAQVEQLKTWARELPGRGACRHPDGASRFTASAINVFANELNSHLRSGRCGVCGASPFLPIPPSGGGWR